MAEATTSGTRLPRIAATGMSTAPAAAAAVGVTPLSSWPRPWRSRRARGCDEPDEQHDVEPVGQRARRRSARRRRRRRRRRGRATPARARGRPGSTAPARWRATRCASTMTAAAMVMPVARRRPPWLSRTSPAARTVRAERAGRRNCVLGAARVAGADRSWLRHLEHDRRSRTRRREDARAAADRVQAADDGLRVTEPAPSTVSGSNPLPASVTIARTVRSSSVTVTSASFTPSACERSRGTRRARRAAHRGSRAGGRAVRPHAS